MVLGILNDLEDKAIAAALNITSCTVRDHYNSAYDKLMPEVALERRRRPRNEKGRRTIGGAGDEGTPPDWVGAVCDARGVKGKTDVNFGRELPK